MLGVDAGEHWVGVALSDELRLLARPVAVLDRRKGLAPVLDKLADLGRGEGVSQLVVGLPLNADGSRGRQAERAERFAQVAGRVLGLPVELWDERLSTQEAEAVLRRQSRNLRRARRSRELDAVAAAIILQGYLDAHSGER